MSPETPAPSQMPKEDVKVPQTPTWTVPWPPSGAWCQFCWHNHTTEQHQHHGDPR